MCYCFHLRYQIKLSQSKVWWYFRQTQNSSISWKLHNFDVSTSKWNLLESNASSFYMSQTVLGWSKFFVPDQKFIYKLWQSQKFCARQKDDLHSVKLVFVEALMPCPFTGPKMFWAGPNFLCQTKNLFTYCGSRKHFVPDKKMICIQ